MSIQRVALIGLGAMGSFFVPPLTEYLSEGNFVIVAGGDRKKRLETKGVSINDTVYRLPIVEPGRKMQGTGADAGKEVFPDLIIMAVKDLGLEQAIRDISALVGPDTQIMSVMNGTSSEEQVAAVYGWEHVLYSYMRVSIVMKDGVTHWDPALGAVYFGEKINADENGEPAFSPRVLAVKELFDSAGVRYRIGKDMLQGLWFKYMCNIGENMTCALLGIPFGGYHYSDHANWIRNRAMEEVVAIAQAKGIALGQDDIDSQNRHILKIPKANKPSTLQDLEAGKKTEVEMFSGNVVRMGEALGIPTPVNLMLYHGIRALEERNAFQQESRNA